MSGAEDVKLYDLYDFKGTDLYEQIMRRRQPDGTWIMKVIDLLPEGILAFVDGDGCIHGTRTTMETIAEQIHAN